MLLNNQLNTNKVSNKFLIKKYNYIFLSMFFLFFFYKFYKNICLSVFSKNFIKNKLNKKKNFFFKKKESRKTLISKRISLVLRKRKKFRNLKLKKVDKGNFFLKKFFFKVLLKNRKFLKNFFFFNKRKRQSKITKTIFRYTKDIYENNTPVHSMEYSILNLLLKSGLFFSNKDVISFINRGYVYINGCVSSKYDVMLSPGDLIQLPICIHIYKYIHICKKLLKKKIAFFKFSN